jgi:integrase
MQAPAERRGNGAILWDVGSLQNRASPPQLHAGARCGKFTPFVGPVTRPRKNPVPLTPIRNGTRFASEHGPVPAPDHLSPSSPLRNVANAWLSLFGHKVQNLQRATSTLGNYTADAALFDELLEMPVGEIRCGHVINWYERKYAETSSAKAFNLHKSLRACLSYAKHRDLIGSNPASSLGIGHQPAPSNPIMPEQLGPWRAALATVTQRRALWVARQKRLGALECEAMFSSLRVLALLESTGRRISEGCKIEVDQVSVLGEAIKLPSTKAGPSVIPLSPRTLELVRQQLARVSGRSKYLFPSPVGPETKHIHVRTVWEAFHEVCGVAKIHGYSPHDLRHGFAWAALAAGARLDSLSRTLGHKDIKTTQRIYGNGVYVTPGMFEVANLVERSREVLP